MLEVRNLTKVYNPKKGVPVRALDGVNIKFEETGMVFVLGKSGSGKSTFLNLIGGLDTITEGDVVIKGKSSSDFSQSDFDSYRNTFIGFIFQEYNILNEFSVGKNIALALELQGKKADKQAVDKILEQVDLQGYANRRPNELSGGQKQRIAIARALIKDPEIIMADEPTGALDSNTGKQVFETLQKLSRTKLVIIVSHDRDYAEFYGDRVIEFADGRIISDIKKYKAQSQVLSTGVSVVDGKILHIKKGHKFTDAEKTAVLGFLENAPGDMIVSKDEKSNEDFRRLARIDSDGNKESFENISPEKQNIKQYDPKQFKLIRSRLPLRHSLKIAGSSLKVKPVRLILTILLSAIAFGLFGLADTVGSYNKYEATYSSMQMAHVDYASFTKGIGFYQGNNNFYPREARMTEADIKKLTDQFGGKNEFDALRSPFPNRGYSAGEFDYSANMYGFQADSSEIGTFYTHANPFYGSSGGPSFGGVIEIPEGTSGNSFRGYNVTGRFPAAAHEVMISRHVFEAFRDLGWLDVEDFIARGSKKNDIALSKKTINNENDLLNLGLPFYVGGNSQHGGGFNNPLELKIVGIIDTQFPGAMYEQYKTVEQNTTQGGFDLAAAMKAQEISSLFQYGYHGALYMQTGAVNAMKSLVSNESKYFDINNNATSLWLMRQGQQNGSTISYAAKAEDLQNGDLKAYFANPSKTTLGENEVLLSVGMATLILDKGYDYLNNFGLSSNEKPATQVQAELKAINDRLDAVYDKDMFIDYMPDYLMETGQSFLIPGISAAEADTIGFRVTYEEVSQWENRVPVTRDEMISAMKWQSATEWYSEQGNKINVPYTIPESDADLQAMLSSWAYGERSFPDPSLFIPADLDTVGCRVAYDDMVYKIPETLDELKLSLKWEYADKEYYYEQGWQVVSPGSVEKYLLGDRLSLQEAYRDSFQNFRHSGGISYAPCGVSYESAKVAAAIEFLIESDISAGGFSVNGYMSNSTSGHSGNYTVVGLVADTAADGGTFNQSGIVLPNQEYDSLTAGAGGDIISAITRLPDNKAEQMEMIRFSYAINKTGLTVMDYNQEEVDQLVQYALQNSVTATLNQVNDFIAILAQAFLYVGIGFAVFAAFLLMNFIMVSISHKKREIGILRAIGARSGDVFMIFFFESLMIALISFALAITGCIVGAFFINKAIFDMGLIVSIINFGIRQFALVLAVSIGVAFVATFLPVFNTSRKKPIDAIRKA